MDLLERRKELYRDKINTCNSKRIFTFGCLNALSSGPNLVPPKNKNRQKNEIHHKEKK